MAAPQKKKGEIDLVPRSYSALIRPLDGSDSLYGDLARSHLYHNRLTRKLQELLLTLKASVTPELAERMVAARAKGKKGKVVAQRIRTRTALCWFTPEGGHVFENGSSRTHDRFRIDAADIPNRLVEYLEGSTADPAEWIEAVSDHLGAIAPDTVWIDRRATLLHLQAKHARGGIDLSDEIAQAAVTDGCWPDWPAILQTVSDPNKTETSTGSKIVWASRYLKRGEPLRDWKTIQEATKRYLENPTLVAAVSSADLEAVFPGEDPLEEKVSRALALTRDRDVSNIQRAIEKGGAPGLLSFVKGTRDAARKQLATLVPDTIREVLKVDFPELFGKSPYSAHMVNVAVGQAFASLRGHQTAIQKRYEERCELMLKAAGVSVDPDIDTVVRAWEADVSTPEGDASLSYRQLIDLNKVLQAWRSCRSPGEMRAATRNVPGASRAFTMSFYDLLAEYYHANRPDAKWLTSSLGTIAEERDLKRRLEKLKACRIRMINPVWNPVNTRWGVSQWEMKASSQIQDGRGRLRMRVISQDGTLEFVECQWISERIERELFSGGGQGKPPIPRVSHHGLSIGNGEGHVRGPLHGQKASGKGYEWPLSLRPSREQIERSAGSWFPPDPDDWTLPAIESRFVGLASRETMGEIAFSFKLERTGPGFRYAAEHGLTIAPNGWRFKGEGDELRRARYLTGQEGLRLLSIDSGIRNQVAFAVLVTLSREILKNICRKAGVLPPGPRQLAFAIGKARYRRTAPNFDHNGVENPAPWVFIETTGTLDDSRPKKRNPDDTRAKKETKNDARAKKETKAEHLAEMHRIEREAGKKFTLLDRLYTAGMLDQSRLRRIESHLGYHEGILTTDGAYPVRSRHRVDHLPIFLGSIHWAFKRDQRLSGALRYLLGLHRPDVTRVGRFDLAHHDPRAIGLWKFCKEFSQGDALSDQALLREPLRRLGLLLPDDDNPDAWHNLVRTAGDAVMRELATEWLAIVEERLNRWRKNWLPQILELVLPERRRVSSGGSTASRIDILRRLLRLVRAILSTPSPALVNPTVPPPSEVERRIQTVIRNLRSDLIKQSSSRVVGCALGTDPARLGEPCHWIITEKLNMTPSKGETKGTNRSRSAWGVQSIMGEITQQANLYGIHVVQVNAAGTSARHALTGRVVVRYEQYPPETLIVLNRPQVISQEMWAMLRSPWNAETKIWRLADGRSWRLVGRRWVPLSGTRQPAPPPVSVPHKHGSMISDPVSAPGGHFSADLNAAVNIGLKAVQDANWIEGMLWAPEDLDEGKPGWPVDFVQRLGLPDPAAGPWHRPEPGGVWLSASEYYAHRDHLKERFVEGQNVPAEEREALAIA